MNLQHALVLALFRGLTGSIFHIHDEQLERIPQRGPLILIMNHINILEIPLIYAHLQPRKVHGMVLAERWQNPVFAWGLDVCETIPLSRGEMNLDSLRRALEALKREEFLLIAPEGTRSGDGSLQEGHPGVIALALRSKAPLQPVVFYGSEGYQNNLKRLRRTDFHIAVGEPFSLQPGATPVTRQVRKQMVDQVMYQVAVTLPPAYRGVYADVENAPGNYIKR